MPIVMKLCVIGIDKADYRHIVSALDSINWINIFDNNNIDYNILIFYLKIFNIVNK